MARVGSEKARFPNPVDSPEFEFCPPVFAPSADTPGTLRSIHLIAFELVPARTSVLVCVNVDMELTHSPGKYCCKGLLLDPSDVFA